MQYSLLVWDSLRLTSVYISLAVLKKARLFIYLHVRMIIYYSHRYKIESRHLGILTLSYNHNI